MHKSEYWGICAIQLVRLHAGIIELQWFLAWWPRIHETTIFERLNACCTSSHVFLLLSLYTEVNCSQINVIN